MLTSCVDTDREVLKHVPDVYLPKFFVLNKAFYYKICDDNFVKRRLKKYYNIFQYKKSKESWKCFYTRVVFSIHKMKTDFNAEYSQGDFEKQIKFLEKFKDLNDLFRAASKGDLSYITLVFKLIILLYRLYCIIFREYYFPNAA